MDLEAEVDVNESEAPSKHNEEEYDEELGDKPDNDVEEENEESN